MPFVDIARELLALPTAPGHEHAVVAAIHARLAAIRPAHGGALAVQEDRWGNTFARLRRGDAAQCVAFVAHTDHPGFFVHRVEGRRVRLSFEGGVRDEYFRPGTPIRLFGPDPADPGVPARLASMGPRDEEGHCRWGEAEADGDASRALFGMWDLEPFRLDGDRLHSRGVDDVAGCAMVLEAIGQAAASDADMDFLAVFTRAEENGFRGALLIAEDPASRALLPEDAWVVSVETSSARPSTPIGEGAILRVGDSETIFDPGISRALADLSKRLADEKGVPPLRRALMDGGCCEATIFNLWGWRSGAVCVPLGNYHNMDAGSGAIAEEFISVRDAESLSRTMAELAAAASTGASANAKLRQRMEVLAAGAEAKMGGWPGRPGHRS